MHQTTIIQRDPAILFSKLDDEYLALDAEAGFCYSLNLVSGRIWQIIEQPISFDQLCIQLQQEYTVNEATCRHDVDKVLTRLAQTGLVKLHDAPLAA